MILLLEKLVYFLKITPNYFSNLSTEYFIFCIYLSISFKMRYLKFMKGHLKKILMGLSKTLASRTIKTIKS